jgi:hypothetical protein
MNDRYGMSYSDAFRAMEGGSLVRLPGWGQAYLRLIRGAVTLVQGDGTLKPYDEPDNERLSMRWEVRTRNRADRQNAYFRKIKGK